MSSQRNQTDSAVLIDEMSPLDILAVRPIATGSGGPAAPAAVTAVLCGFDAANRPLIANVGGAASEAIVARTVVPVTAAALGSAVVVLFDGGDSRHPIIIGVMQPQADARNEPPTPTV